jgi:hypothetical protein
MLPVAPSAAEGPIFDRRQGEAEKGSLRSASLREAPVETTERA